jgi:hypothetical protein
MLPVRRSSCLRPCRAAAALAQGRHGQESAGRRNTRQELVLERMHQTPGHEFDIVFA